VPDDDRQPIIYRFEPFELDTARFELRRDSVPVPIEPQVLSLLVLLVANRHRMVSKDEIIERIWNGRIVSDAALSSRIKSARQALGDDGKSQRLIRTVHGRGFRFVRDVTAGTGAELHDRAPTSGRAAGDAGTARPAIAVLPFRNLSTDPDQEYFSDAISQDIITSLSKHRWLDVAARNASFGYKGKAIDVRQLAEDLRVDYVVDGNVRRSGNRIRVTAQLIDAGTGNQRWSDRYDRDLEDVFAVQDEITMKIVARLEPEIGAAERQKAVRAVRRDLRAWDCYHLGVFHFFKFTAEGNREAQKLLQRSRDLDPEFGEAHAWWAYAVVLGMVYWDTEPSPQLLDEALAATDLALKTDDQNATFYALKARVQLARREYESALAENQLAINLNPTFAAAHCGLADSLAYEGRYEEAVQCFREAIELSPNDPQRWAFLTYGALAHIFKHDFRTAVEWADRACEIPNCQYWTTAHKAVALAHLGDREGARRAVERLLREKPGFTQEFARRKLFYLKDPAQLRLYMEGLALAGVP
jgi:TolB-like protein/Tfp pilus assembly protein PilF